MGRSCRSWEMSGYDQNTLSKNFKLLLKMRNRKLKKKRKGDIWKKVNN